MHTTTPSPAHNGLPSTTSAGMEAPDRPDRGRDLRVRGLLVVAAVAFAAYPALRPYGPEAGTEGARDLASQAWLFSHLLGMVGFATLAFALRSASAHGGRSWWPGPWPHQPVRSARWARATESRAWLALVLLLPYYGAEAYGLQAVARHGLDTDDPGVLAVADLFRYAPVPVTLFGLGFLVLALVGLRMLHGLWAAGGAVRAGAVLTAVGLVGYLPQFFLPPTGRVLHGCVLALGLLLVSLRSSDAAAGSEAPALR